jgi:hypothetical protein
MNCLRGSLEWALMVALVLGAGAVAQAQDEEGKPQGPVIQIGKSDGDVADPSLPPPDGEGRFMVPEGGQSQQPQAPKYWIGLMAAQIVPENPLRAQIDIPENQGLLVASVVPDSPADKAGVKRHDILLRANDTDLREMHDLVELVLTEGAKKGQIAIEVLRRGQRETVYITPEERPEGAARTQVGGGGFGEGFGGLFGEGGPRELLRQFEENGPFEFRNFGPGVILRGEGAGVANIPNGVSVTINRQGDEPAHITIKRGDETWEIVGDDPGSLEQLPEDLRPFVEQMLHGGIHVPGPRMQSPPMPEFGDGRLRERLERMERRLEELQQRFQSDDEPANDAN